MLARSAEAGRMIWKHEAGGVGSNESGPRTGSGEPRQRIGARPAGTRVAAAFSNVSYFFLSNTHQIKSALKESFYTRVHRQFPSSSDRNFRHSIKYPSNKTRGSLCPERNAFHHLSGGPFLLRPVFASGFLRQLPMNRIFFTGLPDLSLCFLWQFIKQLLYSGQFCRETLHRRQ